MRVRGEGANTSAGDVFGLTRNLANMSESNQGSRVRVEGANTLSGCFEMYTSIGRTNAAVFPEPD